LAKPHQSQATEYKTVNPFGRLSLEKRELLGHSAHQGYLRNTFSAYRRVLLCLYISSDGEKYGLSQIAQELK
jgi:hypothetical protein